MTSCAPASKSSETSPASIPSIHASTAGAACPADAPRTARMTCSKSEAFPRLAPNAIRTPSPSPCASSTSASASSTHTMRASGQRRRTSSRTRAAAPPPSHISHITSITLRFPRYSPFRIEPLPAMPTPPATPRSLHRQDVTYGRRVHRQRHPAQIATAISQDARIEHFGARQAIRNRSV